MRRLNIDPLLCTHLTQVVHRAANVLAVAANPEQMLADDLAGDAQNFGDFLLCLLIDEIQYNDLAFRLG